MDSQAKNHQMKRITALNTVIIGLALLAGAGCKHRSPSTTPIPGSAAPASDTANNNTSGGGALPPEPPPQANNIAGIPQSANGLWNGPHKENRDKFAADTVNFDFDSATIKAS